MHLIETHKWLLGAEPPTSTEDTHGILNSSKKQINTEEKIILRALRIVFSSVSFIVLEELTIPKLAFEIY
jgi:hypothetical protein